MVYGVSGTLTSVSASEMRETGSATRNVPGAMDMERMVVADNKNRKNEPDLLSAIIVSDSATIKSLLRKGANVHARDSYGWTPLMLAASVGKTDIVDLLIRAKSDINAKSNEGATALMLAAIAGKTDSVEILINAGANINETNINGSTALTGAAEFGNWHIASLLIDAKANVNARGSMDGRSALSFAVMGKGSVEIVRRLISVGADVDSRDNYGIPVLMHAVIGGSMETVRVLIESKANVNIQANDGGSSLATAVSLGNKDIILALIAAGANVNIKEINGGTPLMLSALFGKPDIADVLIENGADINARDSVGASVLHYAVLGSDMNFAKKVLSSNSAINEDQVPEEFWRNRDSVGVVKKLIDLGANVNSKNNSGITPLILAAQCGDVEIIKYLLSVGADIRVNDSMTAKDVALAAAVVAQQSGAVKILVSAGARTDMKFDDGTSLINYSQRVGNEEIIRMLTEAQNRRK